MRHTFLGKNISSEGHPEIARPPKRHFKRWIALFVLCAGFGGLFATVSTAQAASAATCSLSNSDINNDMGAGAALFPIIPATITDYAYYNASPPGSGSDPNGHNTGCVPSMWDITIMGALVFKLLGILNYFAGALAVLAVIYAGTLYLTGYASEANVKKARTILIGTFVGFFIVLGARLIIEISFGLFGQCSSVTIANALSNKSSGTCQ